MIMSAQTNNLFKKMSSKKEHSLAFCCLVAAVAIVILTMLAHLAIFTAVDRYHAVRALSHWRRLLAVLSVDAVYPLFLVILVSAVKRMLRIRSHRLERQAVKFCYLCLGLIAVSRISVYVGLYVFFTALFTAGIVIYLVFGVRFLYELFKYHFIYSRYY